MFLQY